MTLEIDPVAAHLHLDDPGRLRFEARVVQMIGLDGRPGAIFDRIALSARGYAVSAKESLVENACRAIAEGLRALAPPAP